MRLIDADELIEHVWHDRLDGRERIAEMVYSAPTIVEFDGEINRVVVRGIEYHKYPAVKPRKGKWIIKDNPGTGWYRVTCSECGEDVTAQIPMIGFLPHARALWNYCPDCGSFNGGE